MKNFLVLIADADSKEQNVIMDAFTKLGYRGKFKCFSHGNELLSYLMEIYITPADRPTVPPLVLLDLDLPEKNGISILKQIKYHGRFNFVPVIVISSSDDASVINDCYKTGANSYIVKPGNLEGYPKVVKALNDYWLVTATLSNHLPVSE